MGLGELADLWERRRLLFAAAADLVLDASAPTPELVERILDAGGFDPAGQTS